MGAVEIVYNDGQTRLEALLRSIDRPGDYCMHGRLSVPMPRLEVTGAGSLSFPVVPFQARDLIAVAERAPYGKGAQTLVDDTVRACWQIDATQVTITGGAWRDTLHQVVDRAAVGLGCPPEHTTALLYKLLVYEPGGFFAAHRDTEKVDGMVATLVLSLPVAGAGGALVIRHKERETIVDLRTEEPSELAFAAFYADCVHEIRPMSAGHRIVLVYHLVLRTGMAAAALRNAPDFSEQEARIAAQLRQWETAATDGHKLVWLLEHDYSAAGLSFEALKNADAVIGGALARAAQRTDCSLHAAILQIEDFGKAEEIALDPIDWPKLDRFRAMERVLDSDLWLDGWVAPDGTKPDYGRVPLLPGELLPAGALDGAEPDDEQIDVTGNEGIDLTHSYRRAALVLWPKRNTVRTLAQGGIESAVAYVDDELARTRDEVDRTARARDLVAQLIDGWPPRRRPSWYRRRETGDTTRMCAGALRLLRRFGDETTVRRFLHEIAAEHYGGAENAELLEMAATIAPVTLHGWLPGFVAAALPRHPESVLDLLQGLREQEPSRPDRRAALRDAARAACRLLPDVVGSGAGAEQAVDRFEDADRFGPTDRRNGSGLSAYAIRCLFSVTWHCDLDDEAEAAAALLARRPTAATPERDVPQALAALAKHDASDAAASAGFATLWRYAAVCLLERSATPPLEPGDWVIETEVCCRCISCRSLRSFCTDPEATTLRLPVPKEVRQHLREIIDMHDLDMIYETERIGMPHTLVCTKTRGAYERQCSRYAVDVFHMRLLIAAARRCSTADATYYGALARLRTAISAGSRAPAR